MAQERIVGVALDYSVPAKYAVSWLLKNIVREGDVVLLLIVQKFEQEDGLSNLWEETGAPIINLSDLDDPSISRTHNQLAQDVELRNQLKAAAREKHLTIKAKVYYGDARIKLTQAAVEQKLDCLVTGNRGQGNVKRLLLGSVSDYCVHHVQCPVIVVKQIDDKNSGTCIASPETGSVRKSDAGSSHQIL
ncbi:hypothetical protein R1sor_011376 [Riccia sorocarpa]|uniref:UspA domain-containing protein n=1 Tax=Riccia sorocarpa TaxID=122646 RepID=A0ABD3I4D6_9MARC